MGFSPRTDGKDGFLVVLLAHCVPQGLVAVKMWRVKLKKAELLPPNSKNDPSLCVFKKKPLKPTI